MDDWDEGDAENNALHMEVDNPDRPNVVQNNPEEDIGDSDEEIQDPDSGEEFQNVDSDEEIHNADSGEELESVNSDEEIQNADSGEEFQNVDSDDEIQNADSDNEIQNAGSGEEFQNVDSDEEMQNDDSENGSVAHPDSLNSDSGDENNIEDLIVAVGETFTFNIEENGFNVRLRTAEAGNMLAWEQFILILAKTLHHKETYTSMLRTFEIMNRDFENGPFPENMKQFWNVVNRRQNHFTNRVVCTVCWTTVGEGKVPTRDCNCDPVECGPNRSNAQMGTFFYINLQSQIEGLLNKAGIAIDLLYPYTRIRRSDDPEAKEDVYDGTVYRHHSAEGEFLHSNNHNYSLAMWVDGVSPVKSANVHIVPVFFQILELSPRARQRNSLLAALYVGPRKPSVSHYLYPVTAALQNLYLDGVIWYPNGNDNEARISRFMLLIVSADSEERYTILGMTRHNGHFGCTCCLVDGILNEEAANNTRIYPIDQEVRVEDRTDVGIRADSERAAAEEPRHGVQSISVLYPLDYLDLRTAQLLEPLHLLWKGNFVRLYNNLTNPNRPNYIRPGNLTTISNRIMEIRTPTKLSRLPRGLINFPKFTATEQRNTAWFYWLPCAQDFLNPDQLRLSSLFAEATFIMNMDIILPPELEQAEQFVNQYRQLFQDQFPREEWVYNVHLLKHSARCVRELGPAFVASGFWFESLNRQVVNCVTSPTDRASQIANRMLLAQMLEKCLDMPLTPRTRYSLREFIGKERWAEQPNVAAGAYAQFDDIGMQGVLNELQMAALAEAGFNDVGEDIPIIKHKKCSIDGVVYQVPNVRHTPRYNNSIAYVNAPHRRQVNFIEINSIITWQYGNEQLRGIFGTRFHTVGPAFETSYMHIVEKYNDLLYVALEDVITPGVLVEACGRIYISRLPNRWDND